MSDESTLFEFPCDFPLKVMGRASEDFRELVLGIVQRHAGELDEARIQERASRDGNFVSVTVTITAHSKEQLDNLYRELTSREEIRYVL